ncbi:MAG: archaemetzincin family Zn-dependent metalloprotease [Candidatus Bathyarchaeia archaeon]
MKLGLLRVGQVPDVVVESVRAELTHVFPEATCAVIEEFLPLSPEALDESRGQYRSDTILLGIQLYAEKHHEFDCILGVVDVDMYVAGLNFVFGEASFPGRAAVISLWRLRPEFYRAPPDAELLLERAAKEAVHEVGHTFGLRHCARSSCVMYFSNSIIDTDHKRSLFCERCYNRVAARSKS